jgi:hypothetical protein
VIVGTLRSGSESEEEENMCYDSSISIDLVLAMGKEEVRNY